MTSPDSGAHEAPLSSFKMIPVEPRKLYDPSAPNRTTAIINGNSSNILNWDDTFLPWTHQRYKNMQGNFWIPDSINMSQDKKDYLDFSIQEQNAFDKIIGLLAFLDSVQTDYSKKISDYITDSAVNAIMITLAFQEVVHNESYSYVLSSLVDKAKQDEIFEYWKTDAVLRERNDFIIAGYEPFIKQPTVWNMLQSIIFDVILEGLNFYSGFAFFYNLARTGRMIGTNKMINYINKDEQLHVDTFCRIFKAILAQYPECNNDELSKFVYNTMRKAAELEINWARYIIGNTFEGITMDDLENYIRFMANKRCNELGFDRCFPEQSRENPLKWIRIYEDANMGKQDFFEGHSTNYAKVSGNQDFDDL